ncbi:hypothetical protein [Fibrella aquatilis]|uniref:Lipocalin-like domain-containing protein n=1 Tax=Fibrella aquatilis TaxID=2817059 RepID=A0A939JY23_9BACT|nr:hypothetical protein [Fibrella aquatilis]MBO0929426.1 hypothetical protein [Fibrella aquatilis]
MRTLTHCTLFIIHCTLILSCQPKSPDPISGLIGKVWQAQTVKEGDQLVYTKGSASSTKPGYAGFRLDLTDPKTVKLKDIDGRTLVGTWSVSPDNKRLILENLVPKPTNTIGSIEYYVTAPPTDSSLPLQRTAESRKTGNSINEYGLIPAE